MWPCSNSEAASDMRAAPFQRPILAEKADELKKLPHEQELSYVPVAVSKR